MGFTRKVIDIMQKIIPNKIDEIVEEIKKLDYPDMETDDIMSAIMQAYAYVDGTIQIHLPLLISCDEENRRFV